MAEFDAAGIGVYALSYDEADALRDFRDAHGITYNLLSDPDSVVISQFGILNTLIDADDHPWYGIPYPGTYVFSGDGTITHKFFENNLAVRAGPEQLLRAAQGRSLLETTAEPAVVDTVEVDIGLEGEALARTVQKDLVVRFRVPPGRHVYAEPAAQGMVAVDVQLDANPRLVQRSLQRPHSEAHTLAGSGETFQVHHGNFELRLPLTVNSYAADNSSQVTVSGRIRWQSCDDEVCDIPATQSFDLTLPVAETPPVALFDERGAELEPNTMAHFRKMSQRRS